MKDNRLKYIAYVRKSEEREERQQLSVDAQKREIENRFPNLKIIDVVVETKSAFKPNNRPLFDDALARIENGDADGFVSYHPNRISRNEIDAAKITYSLRSKLSNLKDLKFVNYTFENTPEGIMMLQMALSQSQYESAKQGRDVSRGMVQKIISKQERPGQVPQGYIKVPVLDENGQLIINPKDKKIVTRTDKDPKRYDLVQKMWRMVLEQVYTPSQIRKIVNEEWGFTTRKTRKMGGNPMTSSLFYKILNNQFYAGYLVHNGDTHIGNHEPMVTLDEFDMVQAILGKKGRPRPTIYTYAFKGLIKCGECGCSVVAKTNNKIIKSTGKVATYVHYYCTRKSEKRPCTQNKYTRVEDIETEIDLELAKYTIDPEFRDLAVKILRKNNLVEVKDRNSIYNMQQKNRKQLQSRLDKIVDMYTGDMLDEEEYRLQRDRIKRDIEKTDQQLRGTEQRAENWLELTEKAFDFVTYAQVRFENGSVEQKRDILMTLGENLQLKDKKLLIEPSEWLIPIGKEYPKIYSVFNKVRTNKKASSKEKELAMSQIMESWRAIRDSNPGHPA